MVTKVLVKQLTGGLYQWCKGDAEQVFTGDGEQLGVDCEGAVVSLIAPVQSLSLHNVSYEKHERKVLAQTLPFSLEDELIDDVDCLHFALGPVTDQQASVAVISKELLDQWLSELEQWGIVLRHIIPEAMLLPLTNNGWSVLLDQQRLIARIGESAGLGIDAGNANLLMQSLLDESEELPEQLSLIASEVEPRQLDALLPDLIRGLGQSRQQDYWQVVLPQWSAACEFNVLQGAYAQPLPWMKWWQQWRLAACLAAVAIVLQFFSDYAQVNMLETENLRLRTAIEESYREVVPRGALMDAERQLRSKVQALKGSGDGSFMNLFDRVAGQLVSSKAVQLQSVYYSEKQFEIRLVVVAPTFNEVEQLRGKFEKVGLRAELTGSNKDGSNTRARLRVKG